MNSRTLMLLGLFALGSAAALLAQADPGPEESPTWEYAVYRSLGNRYQWQTPDAKVFAHGLADFCKQLGLKAPTDRAAAEIKLVNHFGALGWELVQTDAEGTSIFWFKRPVH